MDDRKFDNLTRFIGRRASRRAVVKGAAAAALAALFGRAADDDNVAEAAVYEQGGVKQRIRVYCTQAGQTCPSSSLNPTRRCCYKCGPNKKCCEAEGFACIYDSHCCNGLICRDPNLADGVNLKGCFVRGTIDYFGQCVSSGDCETNSCIGGVCCTPEQTCEGGSTCCAPDEACVQDGCCPVENICDLDAYDGQSAECCDPYSETCTYDGCCPNHLACDGQCCDGYTERCDYDPYLGYSYCAPL